MEQARQQAGRLEAEKDEGKRELLGEFCYSASHPTNVLITGKLAETLESQYQCPTCLDLFISPVSLNCGHTYCWLCLAQWRRLVPQGLYCMNHKFVIEPKKLNFARRL